ncbi:hypothetical protein [Marinobacterium sp. BA1]|uniref:hypothetical protein n=1 Tax=Marinobacterium sp. BA1 TaxID=3138931 RepID=UPI0032E7E3DD
MEIPEQIYLVHAGDGLAWSTEPAPGEGMDPADAVPYWRADADGGYLDALPAADRPALLKQFKALQQVARMKERQMSLLRRTLDEVDLEDRAVRSIVLESERQVNEQLSNHVLELEALNDSLQARIELVEDECQRSHARVLAMAEHMMRLLPSEQHELFDGPDVDSTRRQFQARLLRRFLESLLLPADERARLESAARNFD